MRKPTERISPPTSASRSRTSSSAPLVDAEHEEDRGLHGRHQDGLRLWCLLHWRRLHCPIAAVPPYARTLRRSGGDVEPCVTPTLDPVSARREAARQVLGSHRRQVTFGAEQEGKSQKDENPWSLSRAHLGPSSGVMGNATCTLAGCWGIQPLRHSMTSLALTGSFVDVFGAGSRSPWSSTSRSRRSPSC